MVSSSRFVCLLVQFTGIILPFSFAFRSMVNIHSITNSPSATAATRSGVWQRPRPQLTLFSHKNEMGGDNDANDMAASNASASLPPATSNDSSTENDILQSSVSTSWASVATLISQENKRILIEELGYHRRDVERLKLELALVLVEKRVPCPSEGIPETWCRPQEEIDEENSMMQRLEQESKYPLKFSLIGISLILFGKGFFDALITIIKVNIDFPGASLLMAEEFLGIPVLLIDVVCVLSGASLGWWTWKNMQ